MQRRLQRDSITRRTDRWIDRTDDDVLAAFKLTTDWLSHQQSTGLRSQY